MSAWPLAVDMDGTLIHGDVTQAAALMLLGKAPWRLAALAPLALAKRAAFKARLAREVPIVFPRFRQNFLAWLGAQHAAGRALHLITGADQAHAELLVGPLGLFDSIEGSNGRVNLVGRAKAARLAARFPQGFSYAGDSVKDLPVFACARSIVLVGARAPVAAAARRLGRPVEAVFG